MRKISKSRGGDDDVVSSTNGSVTNEPEDQAENDQPLPDDDGKDGDESADPPEANDEDTADDTADGDDDADDDPDVSKKSSGKKTPKGKGRPKKVKKASKSKAKPEKEEEYEVDKIVDSKKIKGKLHYLIRWKGYSSSSDTWEPENTVSCPELLSKYLEKEDSKKKENGTPKKQGAKKRKSKPAKESKSPKRSKNTEWDGETADENAEYEVDRILEVHHQKNGKREFLIHWKGWSAKFDSWEPEAHLNCADLIKKFMDKVNAAKKSDSRSLRVAPETTNRFTLQDPSSGRRLSKRRGQHQRVRYDDAE